MPVVLRSLSDLHPSPDYDYWVAIGDLDLDLPIAQRLPRLAYELEAAFDDCRELWWGIAQEIGREASGELSHVASCAPSPSDFGSMLAWDHLVASLVESEKTYLVVCDDPWVFRQLARHPEVIAGRVPPLWPAAAKMRLRGLLARLKTCARLAYTAYLLRQHRTRPRQGAPAFLVYGHPQSQASGHDAYFGSVMTKIDGSFRYLHTDCALERARELAADPRTLSLHAWGRFRDVFAVLMAVWKPSPAMRDHTYGYLIQRAAYREGAGASGAMTRWQMLCQERWLGDIKPSVVTWPWENHPWEKALVRSCRALGVRTAGYLHTVVGPHMINHSPHATSDGVDGIPDDLLVNGEGYAANLVEMGIPEDRMIIVGATRFKDVSGVAYDPAAPVFVALSSNLAASKQMMNAVVAASRAGYQFVIKAHPMYPVSIPHTESLKETSSGLVDQGAVSAVIYCASVVGLEAILMGIPTIRFLPADGIAMNVLPKIAEAITADHDTLAQALSSCSARDPIPWSAVFAPVDLAAWREVMGCNISDTSEEITIS